MKRNLSEEDILYLNKLKQKNLELYNRKLKILRITDEDVPKRSISNVFVSDRSIYLTGGGSLIKGLDVIIEKNTGLNCRIDRDTINCVVKGLGKIIEKRTKWD